MNDCQNPCGDEIRSFRDLIAWQRAMDLAVDVYRAAKTLPASERFELGRELRRSSISVPSNIAEGFNRHSRPTYRNHVAIALGSTGELETQVLLAERVGVLEVTRCSALLTAIDDVGRLSQGLWRSLA
jgi:four helix bundle protein